MLMLALAAVQMCAKTGETLNEEIEPCGIRVHENLIALRVSKKAQDVARRRVDLLAS